MACTGCQYLIGKEGTCNMTYACAGSAQVKPEDIKPAKRDKKKNDRKK